MGSSRSACAAPRPRPSRVQAVRAWWERASAISMSQTRIGKLEPKVVFTARWHMISRCMYGVLSDGLSGRVPHGTIHTSCALRAWTISHAHLR